MANVMYRELLSKAYPIAFSIVLPAQLTLYYLIIRHSPSYLTTMKKVLLINCFMQTMSLIICCFLQTRQVSSSSPMEIWCYGPLRHTAAFILYILYFISQSTTLSSTILVFLTICLKLEAVRNLSGTTSNTYKVVLFMPVVLVTAAEMSLIISESLPIEVQERFRLLNSDTSDHSVIGYITLKTVPSLVTLVIVTGSVMILPPLGLVIRSKILSTISANMEQTSAYRTHHNRSFINGLTLQAFLPFVCYLPIFVCFFYIITTKSELLFEQYFIGVLTIVPTLLDPFIIMYAVRPYRKKILIWLKLEKQTERRVHVVAPAHASHINI